jgi:hypothetical protein
MWPPPKWSEKSGLLGNYNITLLLCGNNVKKVTKVGRQPNPLAKGRRISRNRTVAPPITTAPIAIQRAEGYLAERFLVW